MSPELMLLAGFPLDVVQVWETARHALAAIDASEAHISVPTAPISATTALRPTAPCFSVSRSRRVR